MFGMEDQGNSKCSCGGDVWGLLLTLLKQYWPLWVVVIIFRVSQDRGSLHAQPGNIAFKTIDATVKTQGDEVRGRIAHFKRYARIVLMDIDGGWLFHWVVIDCWHWQWFWLPCFDAGGVSSCTTTLDAHCQHQLELLPSSPPPSQPKQCYSQLSSCVLEGFLICGGGFSGIS